MVWRIFLGGRPARGMKNSGNAHMCIEVSFHIAKQPGRVYATELSAQDVRRAGESDRDCVCRAVHFDFAVAVGDHSFGQISLRWFGIAGLARLSIWPGFFR